MALRVWPSPQTTKLSLADYYSFQFITIQLRSDVKKRAGWSTLYIYIYKYILICYIQNFSDIQLSMPYFTISLPIKLPVLPPEWPYISEQ